MSTKPNSRAPFEAYDSGRAQVFRNSADDVEAQPSACRDYDAYDDIYDAYDRKTTKKALVVWSAAAGPGPQRRDAADAARGEGCSSSSNFLNDALSMSRILATDACGFAARDVKCECAALFSEAASNSAVPARPRILQDIDEWLLKSNGRGDTLFLYFAGPITANAELVCCDHGGVTGEAAVDIKELVRLLGNKMRRGATCHVWLDCCRDHECDGAEREKSGGTEGRGYPSFRRSVLSVLNDVMTSPPLTRKKNIVSLVSVNPRVASVIPDFIETRNKAGDRVSARNVAVRRSWQNAHSTITVDVGAFLAYVLLRCSCAGGFPTSYRKLLRHFPLWIPDDHVIQVLWYFQADPEGRNMIDRNDFAW